MTTHRFGRILCLITCAVALLAPAHAHAGPPFSAGGTWDDCNVVTSVENVGPNLIITIIITETFRGTFDGTYVGTERDVIFADGSATFTGSGLFTGNVTSASGTIHMSYVGRAEPSSQATANWVVNQGTLGLTTLHGQGTFEGALAVPTPECEIPFAGTYTGSLQFSH